MTLADSTRPRIAFLDVDGTILDHGRSVAASTVDAVRAARAAGHLVYLSTGRASGDIHPAVAAIGFDGAITNGGAYAVSAGETVLADPMPEAATRSIIEYCEANGIAYILQSDEAVYATETVRREFLAMWDELMQPNGDEGSLKKDPQTAPQQRPSLLDVGDADLARIAKITFLGEETDTVERVRRDLGEGFHVVAGSMPMPGGTNGEVGLAGVTKGAAIEAVLDHLGRDAADAIGIGDSWNDLEMFQVCGVGIAMGNADDALKQHADEVTTSVREDGIWNAFRRHGLI